MKKLSGNRSRYFAVAAMAGVLLLFVVTAGPPSGQVSISFQTPFARSTPEFIQLERIVARFQVQNPEIEVRLLPDGPTAPDLITRRTLLRNAPDILEIPLESISGPAGNGTILPVVDALSRGGGGNVFAWALRAAEHDKIICAIPFRARSVQLIYNGSVLRRSGFDPDNLFLNDWADLLFACRDIKRSNSGRGCWALGISARDVKPTSQLGLMLIRQMDAEVIGLEEREKVWVWAIAINRKEKKEETAKGVEALNMVRKLGEYVPPEALDWSRDDLLREFIAGRVAMFFGDLRDVARIRTEAPDVDVRVAKATDEKSFTSWVDFYGGVVNATTQYPESCKELLTYLCSLEAQEMIMKGGPGPPMFSPVREEFLGHEWYDDNANYKPFLNALKDPWINEHASGWTEVQQRVFVPELRKLIAGETEATAAAMSIEELGNEILNTHYGYIGKRWWTETLSSSVLVSVAAAVFFLIFLTVGHRPKH